MKQAAAASKGARTRRVILDASYRLFIKQGFAATSVRDIAERSHLALGGIYNHFPSKEDIFRAIMQERHPFFEIVPLLTSVPGGTAEAYVRNAAHTLVDQLGHHPDFLNLMLIEIVEFKARHVSLVIARLVPLVVPLGQRIASLQGSPRQIPALVLARAFLGMFFSYYITGILMDRAMPAEMSGDAIDHFVDIFLHGILTEERA